MFNKTGKTITIFVALTIILLVCSTSIGFYLYHLEQRLHKQVETELDLSHSNESKLQAQLKDIQSQLALSEDKNKEADQKINNLLDEQDLNEGLRTALKKENADLKEQVANLEQARQKMKADFDDSAAKLSQYQDLLKNSEEKTKELESHLANLAEANKSDETRLRELQAGGQGVPQDQNASTAPVEGGGHDKVELDKIVVNPQDSAKGNILSVDTDAEFVVFNLGMKQGVKSDDLLSVYRGDSYLGDIKATRVQDEMSAADIVPTLSANQIQKNDTVVLKP